MADRGRNELEVSEVHTVVPVMLITLSDIFVKNSFLGWANFIWDRAKGYFNTFHSQVFIQISYFVPKFHKCQIPGPGKCPVMPIGADAHETSYKSSNNRQNIIFFRTE